MARMGQDPPSGDDLRADPDVPEGVRYDPDLAVHEPARVPSRPIEPSRRRSPLLLFAGGLLTLSLVVYVLFGVIADEAKTSSDYLSEISLRPGSAWQTAFELSRMIEREDAARRDPQFVPRLVALFERSGDRDPRLRRYLALTMRQMRDPATVGALIGALEDDDALTRLYAAEALGAIGDPRAVPALVRLLSSPDADLRKVTAHALGAVDDDAALAALRLALNDPVVDVAWNAALSLARRGDAAGLPLLSRMLDRAYLDGVTRSDESGERRGMTEIQKEQAMINAVHGLTLLREGAPLETIRSLGRSDPSLRVRQAALESLSSLDAPSR